MKAVLTQEELDALAVAGETETRRPRRRPTASLEHLAAEYKRAGLRPLVDRPMEMIVMDCPSCRAQDSDPIGLWRPVRVVPRPGRLTILCTACGRHDER